MASGADDPIYGFLEGGGTMAARIRDYDWSATPLGPIAGWPHTLKSVTSLILRSPVPIVTLWGELGIMIYNDAYSVFAAERDVRLLGSEVRKGWEEVADWNDNVMKVVLAGGTLSYRDQLLVLARRGVPEEVWLDLDYSPITDESGRPVGVIAIVIEITEKKRALQRAAALAELGEAIRQTADPEELAHAAGVILGRELQASRAGYGTMDIEAETIAIGRHYNAPGVQGVFGVVSFRKFGSFIEDLKAGVTVIVNDTRDDPRTADHAAQLEGIHVRALVNVPVTEEGGVVAMLYVNSSIPRPWTQEEVGFIREVAMRIRTAIARRRAEETVRQNAERLTFLDALSRETASVIDADAVMAITTRMLGEHLGVSLCAYADMDPDQNHFTIRGDWSAPGSPSIVGYYSLKDFGETAVTRLKAGLPLVIHDIRTELSAPEAAAFQSIGITATICMPLVREGRLTALMAIHHEKPHHWTESEQALLAEVVARSWAHIERARTEAALRRQGEMLLLATGAAAIGTWDFNPLSGDLLWDEQCKALFGLPSDAAVDYALFLQGIHPEDREAIDAAVRAALSPEGTGAYDVEYRTIGLSDGVERWLSATGRGFFQDGKAVRFVGTVHDITAQKNIEVLLERRLQERTVALVKTEQALQQAQKMEAIGNLTGGIAHDFNNLLMAVTGSLELLKKRLPPDPMVGRLIDNAMEGARRGASLTKRMLAFARRQPLQPERIDLPQLVGGMTELLERSLGPMVLVETRFPVGLPLVETDPNQLESALLNLVVNARDAMQGEGRIVISTRMQILADGDAAPGALPPGAYVCLCVTDTGEGMDAETLKRATEPFFTTKGVGKGTGLGLSMVHGLAQQSGGALVLHSQPGQGTTAEIWLPAVSAASAPAAARTSAALPPAPAAAMTILAVDDDALVLMNTADMLEDMGHRVAAVGSGADALRLLEEGMAFDLVITDHAMPQMTGAQLAQEIGRRWPTLKVLLATGYAELPTEADAGLSLLSKPFTQAELAAALARIGK